MRTVLNLIALLVLLGMAGLTAWALYGPHPLPAAIPTHFDAAGNPNGWGTPGMLWLIPGVALALFVLMSVVSRFPGSFNYPVRVTAQNRDRLQGVALSMIAWLQLELMGTFCWIQLTTIRFAHEGKGSLSPFFLPLALAATFGTVIAHIRAMFVAAGPMKKAN